MYTVLYVSPGGDSLISEGVLQTVFRFLNKKIIIIKVGEKY